MKVPRICSIDGVRSAPSALLSVTLNPGLQIRGYGVSVPPGAGDPNLKALTLFPRGYGVSVPPGAGDPNLKALTLFPRGYGVSVPPGAGDPNLKALTLFPRGYGVSVPPGAGDPNLKALTLFPRGYGVSVPPGAGGPNLKALTLFPRGLWGFGGYVPPGADIPNLIPLTLFTRGYGGSVPPGADDPGAGGPLSECRSCGRKFNQKALQKHAKICQKVFIQKRKTYNIAAARVEGSEAAKFFDAKKGKPKSELRGGAGAKAAGGAGKKAKWKQQSEALRHAMKSNRMMEEAKAQGKDITKMNFDVGPTPEVDDDRVPCPHCGRKFSEKAAERHIPYCATKNGGGGGGFRR
eukprot:gene14489-20513_t